MAKLTPPQKEALRLLQAHEARLGHPLEAGDAGTYSETWADSATTGINWRTAAALRRRGLVTIDLANAVYDEPADLYLTDEGRKVVV